MGIVLPGLALFCHVVLLLVAFVAALPALFTDKRGIKLLFIHYYHTIIQAESSGERSIAAGRLLFLGGKSSPRGFFAAAVGRVAAAAGVTGAMVDVYSVFGLVFFADMRRRRGGRGGAGRRGREG